MFKANFCVHLIFWHLRTALQCIIVKAPSLGKNYYKTINIKNKSSTNSYFIYLTVQFAVH